MDCPINAPFDRTRPNGLIIKRLSACEYVQGQKDGSKKLMRREGEAKEHSPDKVRRTKIIGRGEQRGDEKT